MTKIKGKNDGPGGRNEHYDIGNRKNVPRRNAVAEVKRGDHPGAHVIKINGREYVRDNPDNSKKDNVNRDRLSLLGVCSTLRPARSIRCVLLTMGRA